MDNFLCFDSSDNDYFVYLICSCEFNYFPAP